MFYVFQEISHPNKILIKTGKSIDGNYKCPYCLNEFLVKVMKMDPMQLGCKQCRRLYMGPVMIK